MKNPPIFPSQAMKTVIISALVFLVLTTINIFYPDAYRGLAVAIDRLDLTSKVYRALDIDRVPGVGFERKGGTVSCYWTDDYAAPQAKEAVDYLKSLGANAVIISTTYYQDSLTSNTIHPDAVTNHVRTPSDDSLREIINYAHQKEMAVVLKPHVDVVTPDWDEPWRGLISPDNVSAWFASYQRFIYHYADLAEGLQVEDFIVGTELRNLTINPANQSRWSGVIKGVRQRFGGELSYAATYEPIADAEYLAISRDFWNQLDYASLNLYPSLSDEKTPLVEELVDAWSEPLETLENWQRRLDRPIALTEIGYHSADYAGRTPWQFVSDHYNAQGQENAYEALFRVFADKSWLRGMYLFEFPADFDSGTRGRTKGAGDIGYTPWDKPAATVMREWFTAKYVPPSTKTGTRGTYMRKLGDPKIITGAGAGGTPEVRIFDPDGKKLLAFNAFSTSFRGGVRVAAGDVNGDRRDEIIVGAGPGGGPQVRVFTPDGKPTGLQFFAFHPNSRTGVDVAAGDVDGDQREEIIVSQLQGGEAWIKIYRYDQARTVVATWRAFPAGVRCGATVAAADLDQDGQAEIVVGAGRGGGAQVRVFRGNGQPTGIQFFAGTSRNGIDVATGDVDGDTKPDIFVGQLRGGTSEIRLYPYKSQPSIISKFMAGAPTATTGDNISSLDIDDDYVSEILTAPNYGVPPGVKIWDSQGQARTPGFSAYSQQFRGGVDVAGAKF